MINDGLVLEIIKKAVKPFTRKAEMMNKNDKLNGINEICRFLRRDVSTVLGWYRDFKFPIEKDRKTATWCGSATEIKAWFKERKCTPFTISSEKLERYDYLKKAAAGKHRKYKRTLTGTAAMAEFMGVDSHTVYDWHLNWNGCPIYRNKDLQPEVDADSLATWRAGIDLKMGG